MSCLSTTTSCMGRTSHIHNHCSTDDYFLLRGCIVTRPGSHAILPPPDPQVVADERRTLTAIITHLVMAILGALVTAVCLLTWPTTRVPTSVPTVTVIRPSVTTMPAPTPTPAPTVTSWSTAPAPAASTTRITTRITVPSPVVSVSVSTTTTTTTVTAPATGETP